MTDTSLSGDNSPEYVAYRLMIDIARVEKKALGASASCQIADRKWILDTYAECLRAVRSTKGNRR
jgi:hypothetical protein